MLGFILSLITLGFVFTVPTGHTAVVTRFGSVTGVAQQGIHTKAPLGIQSVTQFDNRVQKLDVKAEAASKDLQTVSTDIVVNYHLSSKDVAEIYQQIGSQADVEARIISPAVNEVVKAATAKLTAEEILTKRPELKKNIDESLDQRLQTYKISLDGVSIVNVDFSKEFNAAIEAKQVAEQDAKKAQFVADKATKEAEAEVNRAKGSAEAQRLQQQTLNKDLLQKMWIEKWNGVLPGYIAGDNGGVILQLPNK